MKFERDDDQGVFACAQHTFHEFAAVQQVGANVVIRTQHPLNMGIWFEQPEHLDHLIAFGQAVIDAAKAAKEQHRG